jgi:hypothetical protein
MWKRLRRALGLEPTLREYRFKMFVPSTGQRDQVVISARSRLEAAKMVRTMVDTGVWIIGLAEEVETTN